MKRFSLCHEMGAKPAGPLLEALAITRQFAAEKNLAEPLATRLGIVVEELLTNVLTHGAAAGPVEVEGILEADGDGVRFAIIDNGIAFDPGSHPLPDRPHPETGGGSGLSLVRAWAEIVDYRREDDRNRLQLVIRR